MFVKLFNVIFPHWCLGCNRQGELLCKTCQQQVVEQLQSRCDLLPLNSAKPGSLTIPIYSCALYDFESVWVKVIKRYKYRFSRELDAFLAEQLYSILFAYHLSLLKNPNRTILIPVPLAYFRKTWRGFNQSELLAMQLSQLTRIKIWRGVKRIKNTGSQAHLGAKQRRSNLENAFAVVAQLPRNVQTIVFIDDVMTTGSTMKSVINILRKEYPNYNYIGICLASRLVFS